jgi:hypothetical protein
MNPTQLDLRVRQVRAAFYESQDHWNIPPEFSPTKPCLEEMLCEMDPIPHEALFMGRAEDGLPVMLNLSDPDPGPMLIVGDHGSGKTELLRVIAQYIVSARTPREIQFAVITNRIEEWQGELSDEPHCVGVFSSRGSAARRLVHCVMRWIFEQGSRKQSVLLLVDGLEEVLQWDGTTRARWAAILRHGPDKRVWPLVTLTPYYDVRLRQWLELFHLKILASNLIHREMESPQRDSKCLDSSLAPWFSTREAGEWINFWIPALDFAM